MTDTLRVEFERLVADEPPLLLSVDTAVGRGRRMRLHRRLALTGGAVGVAAVAAVGAVALVTSGGGESRDQLAVTPFALSGSASTATPDEGLSAKDQRIADAIRDASPSGWTFDMSADRWDGWGVEATADDGSGPGRLMIGISRPVGSQLLHPCTDAEFKAGVTCTEQTLADGSVLSKRALIDWHGTQYIDVVVTHPDGTGVMAESGNFVIDWPPPQVVTPEQKKHLTHVTRPAPTYDVDQLARVVLAVDRATS
jgi:hypothetical protein